ncbi:XdhC family protein [Rhodovibrio salinarum]|uniref:Xanthine dehydrogenase n=1 Tax=Rhodovibrio salinarum TaxID=1087 RepID=A0A934QJH2_9PROT|nr:XdhC family protein [Rhodovibrio salinarum]MBK1698041.1 xanthine dehydrogenase [Rhodovibrio salinarum]
MKRAVLRRLQEARAAKRPVALVTDLEGGEEALIDDGDLVAGELLLSTPVLHAIDNAIRYDRPGRLPEPNAHLFVEVFNPPLRLIIVGAVHIAQKLAPMARLADYEVTVVDPRRAFATDSRFPSVALRHDWPDDALKALDPDRRTAVITLTHDPKLDDPALVEALNSPCFYIGALGSTRTHAKRLERLTQEGFSKAQLGRIHGPLGLPLGGRAPAEIALAAMAQMTQVLHGATPLVKDQQPATAG